MSAQTQQDGQVANYSSVGVALHKVMKERSLSSERLGYYLRIPSSEMEAILDGSSHLPVFYIPRLSKVTETPESMWHEIVDNDVFHPDSKKIEKKEIRSGILSIILGFLRKIFLGP